MAIRWAALAGLLLLGACFSRDAKPTVFARAEVDLECSPDEVAVTEVGTCTYLAEGCGKKATYVVYPAARDSVVCCPLAGCYARMDGGVTQQATAPRRPTPKPDAASCDSLPEDEDLLYRRGAGLVTPYLNSDEHEAGQLDARSRELRAGVVCFERVLLLAPAHARALWLRAKTLQALGEHNRAASAFATAFKAQPNSPDVGREYVLELLATKSFPEAVGVAERVAREHPSDATLLLNLALAQLLNADPQGAARTIEQALSLAPNDAHAKSLQRRIADVADGRQKQPQSVEELTLPATN